MKLYLKEISHRGGIGTFDIILDNYLTIGNIYDCELCPKMYDPYTYEQVQPYYIVKCDDDKYRKIDVHFFTTLEEMRDNKLDELGI